MHVVRAGSPPRPGTSRTWAEWRALHRHVPAEPPPQACAMCWGAGRILTPARNGEGLIPCACASCGGRGHIAPAERRRAA